MHNRVDVHAGSNGCLGVKTLFRSCTRLLHNPFDSKQMTGVALVPTAHTMARDAASRTFREAVSASAEGRLTWWDVANGEVSASVSLSTDSKVPVGAVGRSVVVDERFAAVGTDRAKILVWQVAGGGSSWAAVNKDVAQQDQVRPLSCSFYLNLRLLFLAGKIATVFKARFFSTPSICGVGGCTFPQRDSFTECAAVHRERERERVMRGGAGGAGVQCCGPPLVPQRAPRAVCLGPEPHIRPHHAAPLDGGPGGPVGGRRVIIR